ncbi:Catalase domain-containing protein [Mycena chlorophos]|uniref:Catalase domain-containing protein n=1 Tax=Mycena chlorophos TaxID=658473 RepID=A0A8H6SIK6_MYCCL|nr:Catalase domain-containing protein [Mycena chlorophos]
MPLPSDKQVVELGESIVDQLVQIFGSNPGYRPVHARGLLATGTFTPTPAAAELCKAPHFRHASTPIVARFSSFPGLPQIPDTDEHANPRGLAIRFMLAEHVHTDLIAHSTPSFPVRTGPEFLEFFRAIAEKSLPEYIAAHPAAKEFIEYPKPNPVSLATETFYAMHAFKFTNEDGKETFVRYTVVPEAGPQYLDEATLKQKSASYLYDELPERIAQGVVSFKIVVQVAEEGDPTHDVTIQWPEDRRTVVLGTVVLDKILDHHEQKKQQKHIIYDPVPRVDGIEPAGDPLFEVRAATYLIAGRKRRAAPEL